ncbi:MAG: ABC transporter ATP-binding protein, partial [Faecalibacillus sp.]
MKGRWKKFLSYYKPYRSLFLKDMFCAMLASCITLVYPILTRYITGTILTSKEPDVHLIYMIGLFMLLLVFIEYLCNYFIGYMGHVMGTYMERDLRNELFNHYQKLSFRFYDEHNTGQLMSRLTNDLFALTELYHHGPEDIVISFFKFVGAFVMLSFIDVKLTLLLFAILPFMFAFAWIYNIKMKKAFKRNKERIGDINAKIEDNLSGIRVVKSFSNEDEELIRFNKENNRYVS